MADGLLLSALFLNDVANPLDAASFRFVGDSLQVNSAADVEVVAMAGGGTRLVTRPGRTWSAPNVALPQCTPEQVRWLRDHEGRTVWFRDHQGTKFAAVYAQVPVAESTIWRDKGDVELALSSVTVSEVV